MTKDTNQLRCLLKPASMRRGGKSVFLCKLPTNGHNIFNASMWIGDESVFLCKLPTDGRFIMSLIYTINLTLTPTFILYFGLFYPILSLLNTLLNQQPIFHQFIYLTLNLLLLSVLFLFISPNFAST